MIATTTTAEWVGSGALGASALLLLAAAARLGAHRAHAEADAELAAYRARRDAATDPVPAPASLALDIPAIPASPPTEAIPVHDQTLQLHQVRALRRARHRKEPTPCS